ncbi:MAG: hypothetical protein ACRCZO_18560 [Cetobacterium sp.]
MIFRYWNTREIKEVEIKEDERISLSDYNGSLIHAVIRKYKGKVIKEFFIEADSDLSHIREELDEKIKNMVDIDFVPFQEKTIDFWDKEYKRYDIIFKKSDRKKSIFNKIKNIFKERKEWLIPFKENDDYGL